MQITAYHYDAFTTVPNMGNPAGIVFDAAPMSEELMQTVAERIGFNETAFVLPSQQADLRLRYFSPGHEVNLCGHATVASFFALHEHGLLPAQHNSLMLETKAGLLPIGVENGSQPPSQPMIQMQQVSAQFVPFQGDPVRLMQTIGLTTDDLWPNLPILYGSTGLWTLIIPIKSLNAMRRMKPDNAAFPDALQQMTRASIHPFCLETHDPDAQMHGRHFSSPFSGTIEDPVTGTASGVMGAYFAKYIQRDRLDCYDLLVEQGQEMGRDGRVRVQVRHESGEYQVRIAGTAVFVKRIELEIV